MNKRPLKRISFEDVKHSQLEIWNNILSLQLVLGQRFKNPRRLDRNKGAVLKLYGDYIILLDPADPLHNKNCFRAVMEIYNISFPEALHKIYYEILRGKVKREVYEYRKSFTQIKANHKDWEGLDLEYWTSKTLNSKEDLLREKLFVVKDHWVSKEGLFKKLKTKPHTYCNYIEDRIKVYNPTTRYWISNLGNRIGGNKEFKSDTLIIAVNLKSYLAVSKEFDCRYIPSESALFPKKFIQSIPHKRVVFWGDNDRAGHLYCQRLLNQTYPFNFKCITYPNRLDYKDLFGNTKITSDPYDLCWKFDYEYMYNFLKNKIC